MVFDGWMDDTLKQIDQMDGNYKRNKMKADVPQAQ